MPRPTRKTRDESSDAGEVPGSRRGKKARRGREKEINHDRSRNLYENKQNDDNLPGKKATFLYNEATFYAKAHVFCKNRRLFCHFSSVKERIPRFKMYKLESTGFTRG
jgi:hypothetical protein